MRTLRAFAVLSALGVILLLGTSPLAADEAWRTPLTISEPTEIPGMVLEPGNYIVQVVNTKQTRYVVQFLSGDGSRNITTVMAVPNYRVNITDGSPFTYFQRAAGSPQALKDWFYVGNNFGIEFVYPKETAVRIAQTSKEEVYMAPSAKPETTEQVVTVSPELKEAPLPPPPAPKPATVVAQAAPPPPPPPPAPRTLPKTGTNLGLLALAGLASLGAATTLKLVRR
ncbi:MAG TPA: LPXTG cell wall anchor domain-containing protein [Thermoanaerobaculia bacterium]